MFHVYWRIDIEKYLKMRPLSVPIASHILEKMHPTRYYLVYENHLLLQKALYLQTSVEFFPVFHEGINKNYQKKDQNDLKTS